jgi:hypothetical protein
MCVCWHVPSGQTTESADGHVTSEGQSSYDAAHELPSPGHRMNWTMELSGSILAQDYSFYVLQAPNLSIPGIQLKSGH